MTSSILQFADTFITRTRADQLLTLSEGFIKVRCVETALALGWTIQEGAGQSPYGPVADYAVMDSEGIKRWRDYRRLSLADGSTDLAIVDPLELLLEIKARPDWGTKSQAQFQHMDADVSRVVANPKCAFFFVFDPKIYMSFSGEKTETRGRSAVAAHWFVSHFPKIDAIPRNRWLQLEAIRDTQSPPLSMIAQRCEHDLSNETILVLGWRNDATFCAHDQLRQDRLHAQPSSQPDAAR